MRSINCEFIQFWSIYYFIMFVVGVNSDYASEQLINFKMKLMNPIGTVTKSNGLPIEEKDNFVFDGDLLRSNLFMDTMGGFVRERIPERVVHAKGAGAFGYFEVTNNLTDVCKAKLFDSDGKKTPVVVRFSHSSLDKGEADSFPGSRGFAVKFYTEEGNFDIVGFNFPIFMTADPLLVISVLKAIKRNPVTNLRDHTPIWDLMTLRPELVFFFMHLFSDTGIPFSYENMPGFGVHTYQVANKYGDTYFVRFSFIPDAGIKGYYLDDIYGVAASDPDYLGRKLYNTITNAEFPSWTVSVQVLTMEDVKKAEIDVFDVTKLLPEDIYPLRTVGKLVLNRNPTNNFADVEQLAFCPANLVPGILGAPDKVFEARIVAYREAHAHRLGSNPNKVKVNCPMSSVFSYNRDGTAPVGDNGLDSPNYFPNSFNGPVPYAPNETTPELINIEQYSGGYDFKQASEWYGAMSEEHRNRLTKNIAVLSLSTVDKDLQKRGLQLATAVNSDFGYRLSLALTKALAI